MVSRLRISVFVIGVFMVVSVTAQDSTESELGPWEKSGYIFDDLTAILGKPENLPEERRNRILTLAERAYRANRNEPLWDTGKLDGFKPFYQLLHSHGLRQAYLITPEQPVADSRLIHLSGFIPLQDLHKTLRLAEICLLLKDGPVHLNHQWEHWIKGDTPGEGNPREQTLELRRGFADAIQESGANLVDRLSELFVPKNWIYQQLQNRLETINPPVSIMSIKFPKRNLNEGATFSQAREFGEYLVSKGHMNEAELAGVGSVYNADMKRAVASLQRSKGLKPDGILGPRSIATLQGGRSNRDLGKVILNLNRARLLPNDLGKRYLIANLPAAEIYGFDDDKPTVRMKIVFGANDPKRRTPFFRDEMRTVIFRPYWMLPNSIAKEEYLPSIRRDMSYLKRNGYEIVNVYGAVQENTRANLDLVESGDLYLRQQGGSTNALGKVKFIFPNQHYVYFHDTPHKGLFYGNYRAHSHGCVRLHQPEEMAKWVLKGYSDWDSRSIRNAMARGAKREVALTETIPVYLVYFTLFPDLNNPSRVSSLTDYYGLDRI